MNTASNVYKNQTFMSAPPEKLTLMLYDGAIRFVNQSIKGLDEGNLQASHEANLRTQDIIKELMSTLDMNYEISKSLLILYDYIEYQLIQGNIKKDKVRLEEAKEMIQELRDTWVEVTKNAKKGQKAMGTQV